jgi:hypothetical protein
MAIESVDPRVVKAAIKELGGKLDELRGLL